MAGLGFGGNQSKTTEKNLSAGVSFAGSAGKFSTQFFFGQLNFGLITAMVFTAALGFTGSFGKRVTRSLAAASVALTGAFQSAFDVFFSGVLWFGYTVFSQALSAGLSFSGNLTAIKSILVSLTAALGFTGNLVKHTAYALAGTLTSAGNWIVTRVPYLILFAATLPFSGLLSVTLITSTFTQVFTAALSFTGTTHRFTRRLLAGGASFVGSLVLQSTLLFYQSFTAAVGFAGALSRAIARPWAAGLTPTGQTPKQTSTPLSAGLSFTGALANAFVRQFTAVLAFTGQLTGTEVVDFFTQVFTANLMFTGRTAKVTQRLWLAATTFTGAMIGSLLGFGVMFMASLSPTGTIGKRTARVFSAGITPFALFTRLTNRRYTSATSFHGSVAAISGVVLSITLTGALSFSGAFGRGFFKFMTGTLTVIGDALQAVPSLILTVMSMVRQLTNSQVQENQYAVTDHSPTRMVVTDPDNPDSITIFNQPS